LQPDSVNRIASVADLDAAVGDQANFANPRGVALDEGVFGLRELRIGALHFQKLLGIETLKHKTPDGETVIAHGGRGFGDVDVHPVDHGHDGDQGGGGKNNAEQRQEGTELARP